MASSLATSKRPTDSVFLDGVPTLPDIKPAPQHNPLPDIKPAPQGRPLPEGLTAAETWVGDGTSPETKPAADPVASSAETVVDPLCPLCRWRLIDPATMGYCPKCGFCRYIEVERLSNSHIDLRQRRKSWPGLRSVIDSVAVLPGWLSMLLGGSFAILLYAKAIDHLMPEGSSERSMFGFTMLMAGVLVGGLSHLWALLKVAPSHNDVGALDILSPGLIWGTALRRLPETRWPIWLAGWSLTVMFASWFFIAR